MKFVRRRLSYIIIPITYSNNLFDRFFGIRNSRSSRDPRWLCVYKIYEWNTKLYTRRSVFYTDACNIIIHLIYFINFFVLRRVSCAGYMTRHSDIFLFSSKFLSPNFTTVEPIDARFRRLTQAFLIYQIFNLHFWSRKQIAATWIFADIDVNRHVGWKPDVILALFSLLQRCNWRFFSRNGDLEEKKTRILRYPQYRWILDHRK